MKQVQIGHTLQFFSRAKMQFDAIRFVWLIADQNELIGYYK